MAKPILKLARVHTNIAQYQILRGIDLEVPEGDVTMLMGRNGAGKTTTVRTIMGLWRASQGTIEFDTHDITSSPTPAISRLGIAYIPENMGIFTQLTVYENILLGSQRNLIDEERLEWIFERFPAMKNSINLPAGNLSGGQKQMLCVARALIEPRRLILIDEPSKGLAPSMVNELIELFLELKEKKTSILLVEQNFHLAKSVGTHLVIIDDGQSVYKSSMEELVGNQELQNRYLGLNIE